MFSSTSWTDYTIVVLLLLAIYYLTVGIRFYFQELKSLTGKTKAQMHPANDVPDNNAENEQVLSKLAQDQNCITETADEAFQQIEHLMERMKAAIEEASRKKHIKEEFSLYLQLILNEYPELKKSPFRSTISELIISECARHGSIALSEDEVVKLWNEV